MIHTYCIGKAHELIVKEIYSKGYERITTKGVERDEGMFTIHKDSELFSCRINNNLSLDYMQGEVDFHLKQLLV